MNYDTFLKLLKEWTPFAFSRWGDGEWLNIRGTQGYNCDGNYYFNDLGKRLKAIVSKSQSYYMGAQCNPNLLSDKHLYNQNWFDSTFLVKANIDGTLYKFTDILKTRHVVYVGNETLNKLSFIDSFIRIPTKDVWIRYEEFLDTIKHIVMLNDVVLFSAGMCANVFIHDLWAWKDTASYIDVGAIFDPYVGKLSRGYHKNLQLDPKIC
jgi:hypothetical protein